MKRILITTIITSCLLLSACTNNTGGGVIGGADGPTNIYAKGQFGEQYEKKPIRMMNIDGELYYDSGLVSDMTPRCGTLDGNITKAVKENEIPQAAGECNFDGATGYQNATSIAKEVPIDGNWVVFKKFDSPFFEKLSDYKYCFYIKGHLNNAATDSELVVLTDNKDITFSQAYEPMLQSKFNPEANYGRVVFMHVVPDDKWGVSLTADNITTKGLTIKCQQFGGNPTGRLQTGAWFLLERTVNDEWQQLETNPLIDYAWNSIAYSIKENDITEFEVDWEWLYGELPPGFYRLSKEITDFRAAGDFDKEIYQVHFSIE